MKQIKDYFLKTPREFYKDTYKDLCFYASSCAGSTPPLTQVYTANSASVIFSGSGTSGDPLTADVDTGGITTQNIYNSNGTISVVRTVTMNNDLIFDSPTQSTFEINLHNATPAAEMLFRIRNGGGDGGVIIQKGVTLDIDHLFMGQYGSELKIGDIIVKSVTSASVLSTDATGKIIDGSSDVLLKDDYKGGQSPFTGDGTTDVFDITHNLGATPSFFTLTTTEPISQEHLTRTITFPDDNTMRLSFSSAPLVGANANYVWTVYR